MQDRVQLAAHFGLRIALWHHESFSHLLGTNPTVKCSDNQATKIHSETRKVSS